MDGWNKVIMCYSYTECCNVMYIYVTKSNSSQLSGSFLTWYRGLGQVSILLLLDGKYMQSKVFDGVESSVLCAEYIQYSVNGSILA